MLARNPLSLYLVLHVPKTAGTTLRCNFEQHFGKTLLPLYWRKGVVPDERLINQIPPDEMAQLTRRYIAQHGSPKVRCLFGHAVHMDSHVMFDEIFGTQVTPRYITFLREPVSQAISQYGVFATTNKAPEGRLVREKGWTLEEWIEKGSSFRASNPQLRFLLRSTGRRGPDVPDPTSQDLEDIKQRLRDFWFVGTTETFHQDSHYLYGAMRFRRFFPNLVVNARKSKIEVSPETRSKLAENNALDMELYEFVRELRQKFVENQENRYEANVSRALFMRKALLPVTVLRTKANGVKKRIKKPTSP